MTGPIPGSPSNASAVARLRSMSLPSVPPLPEPPASPLPPAASVAITASSREATSTRSPSCTRAARFNSWPTRVVSTRGPYPPAASITSATLDPVGSLNTPGCATAPATSTTTSPESCVPPVTLPGADDAANSGASFLSMTTPLPDPDDTARMKATTASATAAARIAAVRINAGSRPAGRPGAVVAGATVGLSPSIGASIRRQGGVELGVTLCVSTGGWFPVESREHRDVSPPRGHFRRGETSKRTLANPA